MANGIPIADAPVSPAQALEKVAAAFQGAKKSEPTKKPAEVIELYRQAFDECVKQYSAYKIDRFEYYHYKALGYQYLATFCQSHNVDINCEAIDSVEAHFRYNAEEEDRNTIEYFQNRAEKYHKLKIAELARQEQISAVLKTALEYDLAGNYELACVAYQRVITVYEEQYSKKPVLWQYYHDLSIYADLLVNCYQRFVNADDYARISAASWKEQAARYKRQRNQALAAVQLDEPVNVSIEEVMRQLIEKFKLTLLPMQSGVFALPLAVDAKIAARDDSKASSNSSSVASSSALAAKIKKFTEKKHIFVPVKSEMFSIKVEQEKLDRTQLDTAYISLLKKFAAVQGSLPTDIEERAKRLEAILNSTAETSVNLLPSEKLETQEQQIKMTLAFVEALNLELFTTDDLHEVTDMWIEFSSITVEMVNQKKPLLVRQKKLAEAALGLLAMIPDDKEESRVDKLKIELEWSLQRVNNAREILKEQNVRFDSSPPAIPHPFLGWVSKNENTKIMTKIERLSDVLRPCKIVARSDEPPVAAVLAPVVSAAVKKEKKKKPPTKGSKEGDKKQGNRADRRKTKQQSSGASASVNSSAASAASGAPGSIPTAVSAAPLVTDMQLRPHEIHRLLVGCFNVSVMTFQEIKASIFLAFYDVVWRNLFSEWSVLFAKIERYAKDAGKTLPPLASPCELLKCLQKGLDSVGDEVRKAASLEKDVCSEELIENLINSKHFKTLGSELASRKQAAKKYHIQLGQPAAGKMSAAAEKINAELNNVMAQVKQGAEKCFAQAARAASAVLLEPDVTGDAPALTRQQTRAGLQKKEDSSAASVSSKGTDAASSAALRTMGAVVMKVSTASAKENKNQGVEKRILEMEVKEPGKALRNAVNNKCVSQVFFKELVERITKKQINIDEVGDILKETALYIAIKTKQYDKALLLLEAGADVDKGREAVGAAKQQSAIELLHRENELNKVNKSGIRKGEDLKVASLLAQMCGKSKNREFVDSITVKISVPYLSF